MVDLKYFVWSGEYTKEEAEKLGGEPDLSYPNYIGDYKCDKCNHQLTSVHPFDDVMGIYNYEKCIHFKCENC